MKTKQLVIALAAAAMVVPAFGRTRVVPDNAQAEAIARQYGGEPGIAVSGSTSEVNLPQGAQEFLNRHYKGVAATTIERGFLDNTYEVNLANGVEIEFNAAGQLTSIDASDNMALSEKVVKDVLPREAYKQLKKIHQEKNVDEIEFKDGRLCEIGTISVSENEYTYDIQQNVWQAF